MSLDPKSGLLFASALAFGGLLYSRLSSRTAVADVNKGVPAEANKDDKKAVVKAGYDKNARVGLAIAHPNIALIKYWMKRNKERNLPINSSVSLDIDGFHTTTLVVASPGCNDNKIFINNKESKLTDRHLKVIQMLKAEAKWEGGVHVFSFNDFPTAAGLASSASGICALTMSMASAMGITDMKVIAPISRIGSGSACRSLYGGLVTWQKGVNDDGSDSIPVQILPHTQLADWRMVIVTISTAEKGVGSTEAMNANSKNPELVAQRSKVADERLSKMLQAFQTGDFPTIANLAIVDSDNLHSVCKAGGIVYGTVDTDKTLQFVHDFNKQQGQEVVLYTQDAGPNPILITRADTLPLLLSTLEAIAKPPTVTSQQFVSDPFGLLPASLPSPVQSLLTEEAKFQAQRLVITKVGAGPLTLNLKSVFEAVSSCFSNAPKAALLVLEYLLLSGAPFSELLL